MGLLDLVELSQLMQGGEGDPGISVALVDGPVAIDHPDFAVTFREIRGGFKGSCTSAHSAACMHGTFVAGILFGRRGSSAPAICPGCTALLRPIFDEGSSCDAQMPSASPEDLATAITDSVDAGAHVINVSSALLQCSRRAEDHLTRAIDYAAYKGVLIVAASGNHGIVGSSAITRHAWVIPVVACNAQGWPLSETNLGKSIGRYGLRAPGEKITSLGTESRLQIGGGTSAAAAFVTGAIALLWSAFPGIGASLLKLAITRAGTDRRAAIAPPLLNASAARLFLVAAQSHRSVE